MSRRLSAGKYTVAVTSSTEHDTLSQQPARHARLRAIVAVSFEDRVQCQNPGCGHSVHAAVHVVEEDGRLLVLGSTCFAKRYGAPGALGRAQFGSGGGRMLTSDERAMLMQNTHALLDRFEAQDAAEREAAAKRAAEAEAAEQLRQEELADKLRRMRAAVALQEPARPRVPGMSRPQPTPWPWQKEWTSVAVFTGPTGQFWVRVQHRDSSQKLVPWPAFPGWESALPAGVGVPDQALGAMSVRDMVEAGRVLLHHGFSAPQVGRWQDVKPGRTR